MSKNRIAVMLTGDATNLVQAFHTGRLAATSFGSTMNDSLRQAKRASDDYESSATKLGASIKGLTSLAKGAVAGFSMMKVIEMADDWGQYASRMKMATASTAEYEHAQARMVKSAQATFRSIDETRESFINLSPVLRDMGMSLDQSIDVVDSFSGLLVTAGANAQRGASAMNALEKSFQRGKVSAQDWMTIYSTADGILEHLVETTGKSANELRRLGVEGKISAEDIANALTTAYEPVMKQVAKMPTTVGDALTNLKTNMGELVGAFNAGAGGTSVLVTGINLLSSNLDVLTYAGGAAAAVMGARFVAAQMASVKALALGTQSALANQFAMASLSAQISGSSRAAVIGYGAMSTAARTASLGVSMLGGPLGALTLATTVGAGAWLSYKNKAEENKHVLESMRVPVEQLREELNKLTQSQLEERQFVIGDEVEKSEKSLRELAQAVQSIEKDYEALSKANGVTKEELSNVSRTLIEARSEYDKSSKGLEDLKTKQEEVGKSLVRLAGSGRADLTALSENITELSEADFSKLIKGLESSLSVIGMTNQQAAEYKARLEGASEEQARLAGVLAGMADSARQVEKATQEKDNKAAKGAQALLDKLIAQEVQIRMNMVRHAEYMALVAMGIDKPVASQGADTAAELAGLKAQEEIVARIKSITDNISANTVPSLKKTSSGVKQLSTQIDSLVDSLFPVLKAEKDWVNNQKLLEQALNKGRINQTQYEKGLKLLRTEYEKVAFIVPAHVKAIQDEAASIKSAIPGLRERVDTFGLSATAIARNAEAETRARIVTLQSVKAVEVAKGASAEYVRQIEEETKALQELLIYQEHQAGLTQDLEHKEARQQALTDFADEAKRTHDEIERSLTDSLMRSFESGKGFAKSFLDSIKSLASTLILRPIVQPISEGIAGAVTGALGTGGGANGAGGLLGIGQNVSSLYSAATGSITKGLASGIGKLGETFGSSALQSFSAGMLSSGGLASVGAAGGASLAGTVTGSLAGFTPIGAGGAGVMSGAGAALGAAMPWVAGGLAIASIIPSISKMFSGEKRGGAYFQYDQETKQAVRKGGASAGDGGPQTYAALTQSFGATQNRIEGLFNSLGIDASVSFFEGMFEDSKKGRGGVFSGGLLDVGGEQVRFGTNKKGAGYGDTSGSLEEMFENLQKDLAFTTLEAWQSVSDQMPNVIGSMIEGVDVRALSAEQAAAAVEQITGIVGSVNMLTEAFNQLPLLNLRDLTFDATAALMEFAGGVEALTGGINTYYQGFYDESERQQQALVSMTASLSELGQAFPASKQGYRDLVDGLDLSTEAGQKLYVALTGMSGAAASYYDYLQQQEEALLQQFEQFKQQGMSSFNEISVSITQARDTYLAALREQHETAVQAVRDEYSARAKALRDSIGSVNERLRDLNGVLSSLGSGIATLREQSELATQLHRTASLQVIDQALAAARAGQSLANFTNLQDSVQSVSKLDANDFGSLFDFELERAETVNRLKELEGLTGSQIDVQELQLNTLQTQLERLDDWRDVQLELLKEQYEEEQKAAKERFDKMLADEKLRFEQTLTEMLNEQANQLLMNDSITAGAQSTSLGLSAVQRAVDSSASRIATAISNIKISVTMPSPSSGGTGSRLPAFADGGYHAGGWAMVGERGPEIVNFAQPSMIYSHAQSRNLMAGGDNKELVALMHQLLNSMGDMRHEVRAMVSQMAEMVGILDRVTMGGTEVRTQSIDKHGRVTA